MDEVAEAKLWLRNNGNIFYNRVVDCTRKNGYYISCTWVIYSNGSAFYADGNNYEGAAVTMFDTVKDKLFGVCNGTQ